MKKRALAFVLCAVMLVAGLPVLPVSFGTAITASAATAESLRALVNSIPDKSEWNTFYHNASVLTAPYDAAVRVLSNASATQRDITEAENNLRTAMNSLQYRTMAVSVNPRVATAAVGSKLTLQAVKEPVNATDAIQWVSDSNAAVVDSNGVVTIKSYTDKAVNVSAVSNGHASSCTITITNPLASVNVSPESTTIFTGRSVTLTASPVGADPDHPVSDSAVTTTWRSDNTAAATVDNQGVVQAVGPGVATVTATMTSAGKQFSGSCIVTVNRIVMITDITAVTVPMGGTLNSAVGATESVTVGIEPSTASVKELDWQSSDPTIAQIGESSVSGAQVTVKIKALREGTAKITFAATDGSGINGFFNMNVNPAVRFIQVSPEKIVVTPGAKNEKVTATVLPAEAGNQVVTWSSSNSDVCEVNYSGVLNPKIIGTCVITATTTDGSGLSGSCFVRVADPASAVSVDKTSLTMKVGDASTLKATVRTTTGSTYNDVEWVSSNASVATVDSDGRVVAVNPGTTTILAVALDGTEKNAVCAVSVTADLEGIELPESVSVDLNTTTTLNPVFIPAYASNKTVTWSSSDKTVASVSSSGVVTGKKAGNATITCTSSDGKIKASTVVHVVIPVTGVTLSDRSLTLHAGNLYPLTATVAPSNATDKKLEWTSSDEAVASVTQNGEIVAVAGGTCTITCTSVSGGKFASCVVKVIEAVKSIYFEDASETLYQTQTLALVPVITPETATDKSVKWTSSDANIANVNAAGIVTARNVGTAIITATTNDGGFKDSVTITVVERVAVTGISIANPSVALLTGNTYTVSAKIYPGNASNQAISWSSSAPAVATVDNAGEVKAVGPGTAIITAKAVDGDYSARCTITVTQPVTGLNVSATSVKVPVGSSKTITFSVVPSNASNKTVSWYSTNAEIATISQKGVVTGRKTGKTTVVGITDDGAFTANIAVTVYTAQAGIKINSTKVTVPKGSKTMLTATITPADATDKTINWSSSDASIASVSATGQVSGLKVGSVVITASTSNGKYKSNCTVDVVQLATSVTLDYNSLQLDVGKTKTLTATVKPLAATDKTVKWTTSDKRVAKVSSNGKITAVKAGTATIRATSSDGNAKATCKVVVIQRVTAIKFASSNESVKVGEKKYLKLNLSPADASETTFIWKSSDKKVAKVNSKGKVLGVKPGTCVIKVQNAAGTVKAKCTLTVTTGATGLTLDKTAMSISKGKHATLTPIFTPKNTTDKAVTWTSSNNDVATVNANGRVTAKAIGYAVITAKSHDGGYTATCKVNVVYGVTGITLDKTSLSMNVGTKQALKATIRPSYASNQNVTWRSSNKNIVRVTDKGVLKAVRAGTVTITVTTADGGYKASCKVTSVIPATGVELSKSKLTMEKGSKFQLKASVLPADASNKAVKWISGNKKVVTVSEKGVVTAVGAGTAKIAVKTRDGAYKKYCKVTVVVTPTAIRLSQSEAIVNTGAALRLKAAVTPSDAPQYVTWKSSNPKIAEVSASGVVTGKKVGAVRITATTDNGLSAACVITVRQVLTKLTLNKSSLSLVLNESATLTATASPANASAAGLVWSSSNKKVATVSSQGVVSAVAPGTATITVSNAASGLSESCVVNVRRKATGVSLDQTKLNLALNETATLTASVLPLNATNRAVTWRSSNTGVAKVTKKGLVTAVGGGKAVITAVTDDGGFTAKCTVIVSVPVTGISLSPATLTLYAGGKETLIAKTVPEKANNTKITFSSNDTSIATVSADGIVTAVKPGTAVITAKTDEGGFVKTTVLTVLQNVTSITFEPSNYVIAKGAKLQLNAKVMPQNAADQTLIWSTADPSIATVSASGVVTAKEVGETTIHAVSRSSGIESVATVTVISGN